ncbi:MAG: hypothetical protein P8179_24650 [Candidatus Thiodiazotropha sp.]
MTALSQQRLNGECPRILQTIFMVEILGVGTVIKAFDKKFLLGLYLFLRQLQLSIDRSLDDWTGLVGYLSSKTPIETVLDKLRSTSTINLDDSAIGGVERPALSSGVLASALDRKNCLSDEELVYIYANLRTLDSYLLGDDSPDRQALIDLRIDLQYSEDLVRKRINKSALTGKEFVEHFNQNETLTCASIEELVGDSLL